MPPRLDPFSVAKTGWFVHGVPLNAVEVVDGELRDTGHRGEAFTGATFTATAPARSQVAMRITSVIPHHNPWKGPPSKVRYNYVIEYQDLDAAWQRLCPDDYPGAMLIPGSFGSNGDYDPTSGLTFSCREGVASKCVDWGYPPWSPDGAMASYFQACTRMARADYCGNGHSRTVEGTLISYEDLHDPPVIKFSPLPGFEPEAIWGPGRGTQGHSAALCLFKTRWATIPIGPGSPCADLMPDPRTEAGGPQRFCDDRTVAEWAKEGALFINTSRVIDVGLFRWTDGAGHYVTTTEFPWHGKRGNAHGPPGYAHFVGIEGSAYMPGPRPAAISGLVPLFRYTKRVGTMRLSLTTTNAAPGDGFDHRVLDAYVFAPSAQRPVPTAQPLFLHGNGHGSFATTTDRKPPAGYSRVADLGWVPH